MRPASPTARARNTPWNALTRRGLFQFDRPGQVVGRQVLLECPTFNARVEVRRQLRLRRVPSVVRPKRVKHIDDLITGDGAGPFRAPRTAGLGPGLPTNALAWRLGRPSKERCRFSRGGNRRVQELP